MAAEEAVDVEGLTASVGNMGAHLTCGLCGELFNDPCTLPCGHCFCKECITSRLVGKGVYKNECPDSKCTHPAFQKDLVVNQTLASVCRAFQLLNQQAQTEQRCNGGSNAAGTTGKRARDDDDVNADDDAAMTSQQQQHRYRPGEGWAAVKQEEEEEVDVAEETSHKSSETRGRQPTLDDGAVGAHQDLRPTPTGRAPQPALLIGRHCINECV